MDKKWIKRKYNACYRLKQKGVKIKTPSKTIYGDSCIAKYKAAQILLKDFHFVIQTELFI
ncbi:hypothetical protein [Riemerella columbina]|uniref:hypothetical protein n=1 Tax=Riemerella columbina TaxID=103810 RepID=UPI000368E40C|nr:hypothetical protein [Riemerella columbina]